MLNAQVAELKQQLANSDSANRNSIIDESTTYGGDNAAKGGNRQEIEQLEEELN